METNDSRSRLTLVSCLIEPAVEGCSAKSIRQLFLDCTTRRHLTSQLQPSSSPSVCELAKLTLVGLSSKRQEVRDQSHCRWHVISNQSPSECRVLGNHTLFLLLALGVIHTGDIIRVVDGGKQRDPQLVLSSPLLDSCPISQC